jgi:hypothetical protein
MKLFLVLFFLISFLCFSQENSAPLSNSENKGLFFYWGWNRALYSVSDITFTGSDYDFLLDDIKAFDRQSPLTIDNYLNPSNITIPQYNFRLGYFLSDKHSISFGVDHMKYVMKDYQKTHITGTISRSGTAYDGVYESKEFDVTPSFLKFEHTDGLNYLNLEYRRHHHLFLKRKWSFNLSEGIGGGVLIPRSNTTLMLNPRFDQFHLSGFGIGAILAMNVSYSRFFIQTEVKPGYINMPSIRTTMFPEDKAKQQFFFLQSNILFGMHIGKLIKH